MMLELIRHIEYLLTEHDCVIVPGLGGFVLQYVPAHFSDDHNTWQPPSKQITFNASLSYHDGLLAQSLMQDSGMSYEAAVAAIEHQVADMKKCLSAPGDTYLFGELGTFGLSTENTLVFEPNTSYQFAISSFGLKPINIRPLSQLHKESDDVADTDLIKKKRDVVYIPINKGFIRQLVAAAAVIIVLLMISTPITEIKTTSDYAALVSSELFDDRDKIAVDNNVLSSQQAEDTTCIVTAEDIPDSSSVQQEIPATVDDQSDAEPTHSYIIVVATLSGKQAALRQLDYFKQQGLDADFKIYETANKVRIYIESFSDKKDAQDFLMSLRNSDSPFPDAWVMHIKK